MTQEIAEDALIEAHTQFDYKKSAGPIAVYQCEDCGYYHLTSKGSMNPKLHQFIQEGKINLLKQANHWINKMKK